MNEQFITTSPRYGFVNVFTKLTEGQSEYQKQYLILANYMTAIRKMVLDTSDLPKKYHDDAQSCFDEIQKVVSRYSYSIGNQLKDIPENMLTSLTEITECFNEAIPAATRLSNQQGIDGDILAVKKAIRKSLNFVDNSIDDCITIIDNINKFCNGGGIDGTSLDDIATNAEQLVRIMAAGCKDYNQHIAYLQSLIDQLNGQVKSVTAAEIGVGIGVGVFLAIGGVAIGLMVSGGAGTPIVFGFNGIWIRHFRNPQTPSRNCGVRQSDRQRYCRNRPIELFVADIYKNERFARRGKKRAFCHSAVVGRPVCQTLCNAC